jgi:hypothetical protein
MNGRNENSEKNCENPGHEKTDIFLERVEPTLELAISDIVMLQTCCTLIYVAFSTSLRFSAMFLSASARLFVMGSIQDHY